MKYVNYSQKNLNQYAHSLKKTYSKNDPFPHIVLDNFFDINFVSDVADEVPDLSKISDTNIVKNSNEVKFSSSRGDYKHGQNGSKLIQFLNSSEFIDFLQVLTSIKEPLVPDPHLIGGGLHQGKRGGMLKVHADFCRHPETKLDRRVNALVYLNKSWEESYGGALELWDLEMKECVKKIFPIFNRIVIFNTTDFSYHGHPNPLNCPGDQIRKSIALYYYSNGRPKEELRESNINQSTLFQERPNEKLISRIKSNYLLHNFLKEITPPVILKGVRSILSKNE